MTCVIRGVCTFDLCDKGSVDFLVSLVTQIPLSHEMNFGIKCKTNLPGYDLLLSIKLENYSHHGNYVHRTVLVVLMDLNVLYL